MAGVRIAKKPAPIVKPYSPSVVNKTPMPLQQAWAWLSKQLSEMQSDPSDLLNPMSGPAAVGAAFAKKPLHQFLVKARDAMPTSIMRKWDQYVDATSGSKEVLKYLKDYIEAIKNHPDYSALLKQMSEPILKEEPRMFRTIRLKTEQQAAQGPFSQIGPRGFSGSARTADFFNNGEPRSILMQGKATPESFLAPGLPIEYEMILDPAKMKDVSTQLKTRTRPKTFTEGLLHPPGSEFSAEAALSSKKPAFTQADFEKLIADLKKNPKKKL